MARKRPPAPVAAPPPTVGLTWHPALSAGRCIETWCPDLMDLDDQDRAVKAWTRFRNAARHWKALTADVWSQHPNLLPWWARGSGGPPWSFVYLRAGDPRRLAEVLDRRGLPPDWRPSPAPRPLRELLIYQDITPTIAALLLLNH